MFEFTMENFPQQNLSVARATITLFAQVLPWRDTIGLYVEITTHRSRLSMTMAKDIRTGLRQPFSPNCWKFRWQH